LLHFRCFPHITHLACKVVLKAITNIDFDENDADNFEPDGPPAATFMDAIERDPIATLRTIVRQIRSSSLRRQFFSDILKTLKLKDLELLQDVITRWSSTLLMIDRGILLQSAVDQFLSSNQFEELRKYKLGPHEWEALKAFKKILDVPHAFQQKLSAEKTPTLGLAFPAFESMIAKWEQMQLDHPELADIIQKGLDKLGSYQERVESVPAYVLAMRKCLH
ncbi:ribonuclease H-like domain-containing protein, partial [Mycena crocata]